MSLANEMKQLSEKSLVSRAAEYKKTDVYRSHINEIKQIASKGVKQYPVEIHTLANRLAFMEAMSSEGFVVKQGKSPAQITVIW